MRVAILDDIQDAWRGTEGVKRLRERAEVMIFTKPFGSPSALRGFDALIANRERTKLTRELLSQLPDLRVIAQTGNHAAHLDFKAAADLRIVIAHASGGYSIGAAELTIGLAQAVMRRIPECDAALKRGEWPTPLTPVLSGKTLGLVGLGRLGKHVAGLGRAYGMRVLAWSRTLTDAAAAEVGAERRDLDELLAASDVVSIHVSLAQSSRDLIDARRLALMKPTRIPHQHRAWTDRQRVRAGRSSIEAQDRRGGPRRVRRGAVAEGPPAHEARQRRADAAHRLDDGSRLRALCGHGRGRADRISRRARVPDFQAALVAFVRQRDVRGDVRSGARSTMTLLRGSPESS